ncbi:hypothetical protein C6P45_005451 [Maudiozyma exigua]|uniref:Spindle pole component 29 n=1 Tax=Maudiozyma exigua TaxID=34358 RepID=A0A9P6W8R1_MAUEX|nr:hypothetical protein C6P45_005451 [Kazachstania exigua]
MQPSERQSNESSNVRDFFKRPENEDTLHYLKRQHQEQMKRMDELDVSPIVSPLINKNRSPNNSSINNIHSGHPDLLRQQLRGEIPLPSSALSSSSVFPNSNNNNISNNGKRNANINNFQYSYNDSKLPHNTNSHSSYISAAATHTNDSSQAYRNTRDNSASVQMDSLLRETESLRDIVYQQQRDIRTMNMLLDNERNKNTHLNDRLNHLEDKLQMMEMNSRLPTIQRSYDMVNSQSRITSSRNSSNNNTNQHMFYDSYPPSSNGMNNNQTMNQSYRNQEFISSPTTATTNHPFSIVDDKTTNLLFSKKTTQKQIFVK